MDKVVTLCNALEGTTIVLYMPVQNMSAQCVRGPEDGVPWPKPPPSPVPASCGEFKATFGTGLICAAMQQCKPMHRESCADAHMPVVRGYMRALYPLLYGPFQPPLYSR